MTTQIKLLSFHNDPALKQKYVDRLNEHPADELCLKAIAAGVLSINTTTGIVISLRANRIVGGKNTKGYLVYTLHFKGERQQVKLHRLIWLATGKTIAGGFVIDHINGKKDDNRIQNLRLADPTQNSNNRRSYKEISNPAAKLNTTLVNEIRREYKVLKSYFKVAKNFNVSKSLIAQVVREELWAN